MKRIWLAVAIVSASVLYCVKEESNGNPLSGGTDETAARGSISGYIVSQIGSPLKGIRVQANSDSATPAISDANGYFKIGQVIKGAYTLSFWDNDWVSDSAITVSVGVGQDLTLTDSIVLRYRWVMVSGTVTKEASSPVPGAGVAVEGLSLSALTASGGNFVLDKIDPGIPVKLIVAKSGFGFTQIDITSALPGDTTRIGEIKLDKQGGNVEGQVLDANGNPVSGLVVQAVGGGVADTSDAQGNYRLTNMPSGVSDVRISVMGADSTGGALSGVMVSEGKTISGADIILRSNGAYANDAVTLDVSDRLISDTTSAIIIYATASSKFDSIVVQQYRWSVNNTAPQTTTVPALTVSGLPAYPDSFTVSVVAVDQFGDSTSPYIVHVKRVSAEPTITLQVSSRQSGTQADSAVLIQGEYAWFFAQVTDLIGGIDTVVWNFGDGSADRIITGAQFAGDSIINSAHPYDSAGRFTAGIRVVDTDNNRDSASVVVQVNQSPIVAPVITYPADGDTVYIPANDLRVQWQGSTSPGVSYRVDLDRSVPPAMAVQNIGTTFYTAAVEHGKTYFWKVSAVKGDSSASSALSSFTVVTDSTIPSTDILITPIIDSMLVDKQVMLEWKRADSLQYKVLLGAAPSQMTVIRNYLEYPNTYSYSTTDSTGRLSFTVSGNQTYYWQVVIKDAGNREFAGPIWYFRTPNSAPQSFALVSPTNRSTILINTPLEFKWQHAQDDDALDTIRYLLIRDQADIATTVIAVDIDSNRFVDTTGLPAGGADYTWRVAATDGKDTTYSSPWKITPNAPPVITTLADTLPDSLITGVRTSFTIAASDPENATVRFSSPFTMPGLSATSAQIYLQPGFVGDTIIPIVARDQYYATAAYLGTDTLFWPVSVLPPYTDTAQKLPVDNDTLSLDNYGRMTFTFLHIPHMSNRIMLGTEPTVFTDTIEYGTTYSSRALRTQTVDTTHLEGGQTYFWKMAYVDTISAVRQQWESPVRIFTVANQAPAANYKTAPADNSNIVPGTEIVFSWLRSSDLNGDSITYLLYVKRDAWPPDSLLAAVPGAAGDTLSYSLTGGFSPGRYYWNVKATDGKDTTDYYRNPDQLRITTAPQFTTDSATFTTTAEINRLYRDTVAATDADGDAITYTLVSRSSGMSVNSSTGAFSWLPAVGMGDSTHTVKVRAYDWSGASDTITWTIAVAAPVGSWSVFTGQQGFSNSSITNLDLFKYNSQLVAGFNDHNSGGGVRNYNGVSWRSDIPDPVAETMYYTNFASDGANLYCAATQAAAQTDIYVFKYNGTTWDTVGAAPIKHRALELDLVVHNDTPYVAARSYYSPYSLAVFTYSGTAWDTLGSVNFTPDDVNRVTIDIYNGKPVVAFQDISLASNGIGVWAWDGAAWAPIGAAQVSDGYGDYPDLSIDESTGHMYVAYYDTINGATVTVRKYDGATWSTVGTRGFTDHNAYKSGSYSNVSLDVVNGVAYAAYTMSSAFGYKASVYAYNGSAWSVLGYAGVSPNRAYDHDLLVEGATPYLLIRDYGASSKASVLTYTP
ncbi:MAG: hypothetical protein GF398_02455 [Chitinivibrionales bacterium]|nr:hypothetical protein [Chitinivibrionales bacterium]